MKRKKYEQRRQHFVPACYLKAWLDPSAPKTSRHTPYVWLFDRKGENPKAKPPEKIFRESDMYTLTAPDGGRDLRLEHGLGTVESNFTRVRTSKFNFTRPLTDEDWLWACLFIATAHNRTASNRDHFLGQMEMVKAMFEKAVGPDWETRTVEPELPPHVDRSKVYIPPTRGLRQPEGSYDDNAARVSGAGDPSGAAWYAQDRALHERPSWVPHQRCPIDVVRPHGLPSASVRARRRSGKPRH